jgi:hypothetical protein
MLPDSDLPPITRENLNVYLKDLGKEFRKRNGKKTPAEIILIGGAAVLANYGFRELTYDIDAIIFASSVMKEAITCISDKHGLPHSWLNADFKRTTSYSEKLFEVSVYYRTFSNVLTIRVITGEYLLAMKLMSGRQYKYDLSDVVGVLWEHQKNGLSITRDAITNAIAYLYGDNAEIPETSKQLLDAVFTTSDYEALYQKAREGEIESKELLLEFDRRNPKILKGENINDIINSERRKRLDDKKAAMLAKLEDKKNPLN